ncbi:hypothetical protein HY504_01055 [Candidatus Wolfebacteria bacterium]|nr:hypothetical protein [Candidatus Wolfebacteria bacterium]
MKYALLERFSKQLESFSESVQGKFWKQLNYLLRDLRHPSLRSKKYDESRGIWQARVDKSTRFYFLIDGDKYILLEIKKHPE